MIEARPRKSDLGVRTASAIVMLAIAGTVLWLGGWWWRAFVILIGLGLLWEWFGLVRAAFQPHFTRAIWVLLGIIYVSAACAITMGSSESGRLQQSFLPIIAAVVATDVGAYFAGRSLGGPKLAPKISPGKTWSGLCGGVLASGVAFVLLRRPDWTSLEALDLLGFGMLLGLVAQCGDLFESWLKRRAGVKDSGKLIPGHGGLLDRLDGFLAVQFFVFAALVVSTVVFRP